MGWTGLGWVELSSKSSKLPLHCIPPSILTHIPLTDIGVIEIHEAFAGQVLSNLVAMESKKFADDHLDGFHIGELPMDKINTLGGSLSLGHPFGATGGRLVTTASNRMVRGEGKVRVICLHRSTPVAHRSAPQLTAVCTVRLLIVRTPAHLNTNNHPPVRPPARPPTLISTHLSPHVPTAASATPASSSGMATTKYAGRWYTARRSG